MNSQGNSQTSNEGCARENDPEPVGVLCVVLCVELCVVFCVELSVVFHIALPVVVMLVPVAVAAGVPVPVILARTDAGHVGPALYVEQRPSNPCEVIDDA